MTTFINADVFSASLLLTFLQAFITPIGNDGKMLAVSSKQIKQEQFNDVEGAELNSLPFKYFALGNQPSVRAGGLQWLEKD